ncbi:MAG TPA: glycosyltransferase family 9 protein [Burkholderiaceae bacterium]|nr:glycosyltransferase family 9 protein [Burkholderiaceae bacterium]
MSRLSGRFRIFARALPRLLLKPLRRRPRQIRRVLIAHHLLLGDTLLLAPLLAKLRARYPDAEIALACPPATLPLFGGHPFQATALPFDRHDASSIAAILHSGPYDLGIVPGDNRYSWLALAAGCRWIVAHSGDAPAWKNWPVDETVPYPDAPAAWADFVTELVEGAPPRPYRRGDWAAPNAAALPDAERLAARYVVFHLGASSAVKRWPADRWRRLAQLVESLGYAPVWSGGPGEAQFVRAVDPEGRYPDFAGRLDLGQVWHLFAGASAVVCPDTGVAHLGRLIGVPTVTLFGPGNPLIHGAGEYWADMPFVPVWIPEMPCRDQPTMFRREAAWIRRCDRNATTCVAWRGDHAQCMGLLSVESVGEALRKLLAAR